MISFSIKMNFILSLQIFDFFQWTQECRNRRGERAINVRSEKGENRYPLWHYLYISEESTRHKALIMKEV